MLRRTVLCRSESVKQYLFPHGLPRRTFPFREELLHPQTAPFPRGYFFTKYVIAYDLLWGLPLPFCAEAETGKPHHFLFGNNGGVPHHFWEYQDGWKVPNTSGVRRWVE